MAIYAGETVKIYATSLTWDDEIVTPASGLAWVSIYNSEAYIVVDSEEMEWSDDRTRWEYSWYEEAPGTYTVEVTTDCQGDVAKEVRRIKLESPYPVPTNETDYFVRVPD